MRSRRSLDVVVCHVAGKDVRAIVRPASTWPPTGRGALPAIPAPPVRPPHKRSGWMQPRWARSPPEHEAGNANAAPQPAAWNKRPGGIDRKSPRYRSSRRRRSSRGSRSISGRRGEHDGAGSTRSQNQFTPAVGQAAAERARGGGLQVRVTDKAGLLRAEWIRTRRWTATRRQLAR